MLLFLRVRVLLEEPYRISSRLGREVLGWPSSVLRRSWGECRLRAIVTRRLDTDGRFVRRILVVLVLQTRCWTDRKSSPSVGHTEIVAHEPNPHSQLSQVGGFLGETGGWRWVAALICILTGTLTLLGFLLIPETYSPVLLRRRAALLSKHTDKVYRSKHEAEKPLRVGELFKTALARPWILLFREPIVFLLSL